MKRLAILTILSGVLATFAALSGCGGQDPGQPAAGSITVPPKDDKSPFSIPQSAKGARTPRR